MASKSLGGNISESSLIKTAQSAQTTLYAYNDKAAADDWENSAKTAQDYQTYQQYINSRIKGLQALPGAGTSVKSQSQLLGLNQTLMSAQRSYSSAEVGRQTINVLYGNESNTDKYNKIQDLMQQAASTGDANLYQQLDETRARLSMTIQNEQIAAANKAQANASKLDNSSYTQATNEHTMAQNAFRDAYEGGKPLTNPDGSPIKVQYQNGQPVLKNGNLVPDPNGQPLQLNAQSYASLMGASLKAQAATIQQHIQATGDPNGTYAKDLSSLQSNPAYKQYASDEGMAESGSSKNPYVTDITQNPDGTLTRSFRLDPMVTTPHMDANGNITTSLQPQEGVVGGIHDASGNLTGGKFVDTASLGSSPNSPTDRTSSTIHSIDLTGANVNVGGMKIGGYGKQAVIANPNQNALPSGAARSTNLYIAPDSSGVHSVLPLKNGGKAGYVTAVPSDFEKPGMPDANPGNPAGILGDIGTFLANKPGTPNVFVNDLGQLANEAKGGVVKGAEGLINTLKSGQQGSGGINPVAAIMGNQSISNRNQQLYQQEQAALAKQRGSSPSNNAIASLSPADRAAWNSWLSRNTPQALAAAQAADARMNAQTIANQNRQPTPAQNYLLASGGRQDPSSIASGINAATGLTKFGGSGAWWNI